MTGIQDLIESVVNEKSCNSLLPYDRETFDYFYSKLQEYKNKEDQSNESKLIVSVKELDLDRIEYLLKEYLLCRLNKLKHNFFIDTSLLSEAELKFYDAYIKIFQEEDILDKEIETERFQNEVVGFICKAKSINLLLDGEQIEVFKGDFFVTEIKNIFRFIKNKSVRLV